MYKYLSICILLLANTIACTSHSNKKFPLFDTVVNEFYSIYSPDPIADASEMKFEKKPDGWHVTNRDYTSGKTVSDILFWSEKRDKFLELNLKKTSENTHENNEVNINHRNEALQSYDKRNYNFCPYYGYSGWDKDVIRDYENENNLPDSTLYALGRAYSSYAGNLLNANSGYQLFAERFELPDGQSCLTQEQLELFRKYQHLAISTFKKLRDIDPNFETIIGSIDTRYSNEYVTSFLDLRTYQNENEAKKELIPGLYNDFMISFAKNMLNSCERNAILFVHGDSDTFPLLYVQAQYGFRSDVLVVNLSLLQTDRYINSLRTKILDAEPLPITFSPTQIKGEKREFILIKKAENQTPMDLMDVISFVSNDNNVSDADAVITNKYPFIPTNELSLKTINNTIYWKTKASYFCKNDLMVCDVLANTKLNRPVYFSACGLTGNFFNITNYLQQEGLVNKIISAPKKEDDSEFANINTSLLFTNLMKKYDWKGMDKITKNEKAICSAYRNNFQILISELMKKEQTDSLKQILDKYIEIMPDNVVHFDMYTTSVILGYYKIKEIEKGNKIAKILIHNINNKIDNNEGLTYYRNDSDWDSISIILTNILTTNGQNDLIKTLRCKPKSTY